MDPQRTFGHELLSFCADNFIHVADVVNMDSNTFTYVSDSHGTTSWLDHILCSSSVNNKLSHFLVNLDYVGSDHFPLSFEYDIDMNVSDNAPCGDCSNSFLNVKWDKVNNVSVENYHKLTEDLLSSVLFDLDAFACNTQGCDCRKHQDDISKLYDDIINSLQAASDSCFHQAKRKNFEIIPGWSDNVKDLHEIARETFLFWVTNGKPRAGPLFSAMKITRAQFRLALKRCRQDEEMSRADGLAKSFENKNYKDFWSSVKKTNNNNASATNDVEDIHGEQEVCNMWAQHYEELLNCVNNHSDKNFVDDFINANKGTVDTIPHITVDDVKKHVLNLKRGKAAGFDSISAEHFIFASSRVYILLSLCFNAMIRHGYVPSSMTKVILVPIVKNKTGDTKSKNNYRPIALACISSKVFECILVDFCNDSLVTDDRQFAFKSNTLICVF